MNISASRKRIHNIIFESDTKAGKAFDLALLITILLSVLVVMLESVNSVNALFGPELHAAEWFFTLLFTVEFALRLFAVKQPIKYVFSFFGIIDLLSIIPTYLSFFLVGTQSLLVIRSLRLLRIFRILKLSEYVVESNELMRALQASKRKILVFLLAVLALTIIMGTAMYLIEGGENGFDSIPNGIYWAIVTLTTVGYGDISPVTVGGKFLASVIMILGYAIIAVPTGIVTTALARNDLSASTNNSCENCGAEGHKSNAKFCYKCGHKIELH